jgi:hypothetical protein
VSSTHSKIPYTIGVSRYLHFLLSLRKIFDRLHHLTDLPAIYVTCLRTVCAGFVLPYKVLLMAGRHGRQSH